MNILKSLIRGWRDRANRKVKSTIATQKLKIFVSGTQDDMKPERTAVDRAVNATKIATGIRAETAVSQPQSPRAWIEQQIRECNIYIGVYSHRYGRVIPGEYISATEFEFNLARQLGKTILVWIRDLRNDEKSKPDFDRQEEFLKRVSDFSEGYLRQEFSNSKDLEKWVTSSLTETFVNIIRRSTEHTEDDAPSIPVNDMVNAYLQRQLTKEKNSRKYIPDIFVEVAEVKDQARYFAHPVLFYKKAIDEVEQLNFSDINRILHKLGMNPVQLNWQSHPSLDVSLDQVNQHVGSLSQALQHVRDEIAPYAFPYRTSSPPNAELVPPQSRYMLEDMQYNLGGAVSSLQWNIDDLVRDLALMNSRLLMVLARAGQGKTNFVCNFAETVLWKRSIPCIFFTGRDFNHVAPELIGDYFVKAIFGDKIRGVDEALPPVLI